MAAYGQRRYPYVLGDPCLFGHAKAEFRAILSSNQNPETQNLCPWRDTKPADCTEKDDVTSIISDPTAARDVGSGRGKQSLPICHVQRSFWNVTTATKIKRDCQSRYQLHSPTKFLQERVRRTRSFPLCHGAYKTLGLPPRGVGYLPERDNIRFPGRLLD